MSQALFISIIMKFPEPIDHLISQFSRWPGVGRKSAWRMVQYMLSQPADRSHQLAQSLLDLKLKIRSCEKCFNFTEEAICEICLDSRRDHTVLCVVEKQTDLYAFEKSGSYNGMYHILGGVLSPMDGIGPDDLHIPELIARIQAENISEIILATGYNLEGESTALYIDRCLAQTQVKRTRLARGIPMGSELEYLDELTLTSALEGRSVY